MSTIDSYMESLQRVIYHHAGQMPLPERQLREHFLRSIRVRDSALKEIRTTRVACGLHPEMDLRETVVKLAQLESTNGRSHISHTDGSQEVFTQLTF